MFFQEALAITFEKELAQFDSDNCIFKSIAKDIGSKRDYIVKVLNEIGMKPIVPEGGFFVVSDWTPLGLC